MQIDYCDPDYDVPHDCLNVYCYSILRDVPHCYLDVHYYVRLTYFDDGLLRTDSTLKDPKLDRRTVVPGKFHSSPCSPYLQKVPN